MNPSLNLTPVKPRQKIKIFGILLALLAAGVSAWFAFGNGKKEKGEHTGKVQKETLIQRVTIPGAIEPIRTSLISPAYDGYVKKLFVKLGQEVKVGDPIVSVVQSLQAPESVFPIRAPFSGTVTQILKLEGQFARKSDTKDFILRIDDLGKIFVNANAPEIDVLKLQSGLEAVIKISAVTNRNYKGVVREISQASAPREGWGRTQVEYSLKIEVLDADERVRPGMTAIVDIITNKKENVLTLKHEFIQKENDQFYVILKDGKRANIKVGLQNESAFEITEGLVEGQEIKQVDFVKLIQDQET